MDMSTAKGDEEKEPKEKPIIVRNTTDLQRLKLEKLMKNPVSYIYTNLNTSLCNFYTLVLR